MHLCKHSCRCSSPFLPSHPKSCRQACAHIYTRTVSCTRVVHTTILSPPYFPSPLPSSSFASTTLVYISATFCKKMPKSYVGVESPSPPSPVFVHAFCTSSIRLRKKSRAGVGKKEKIFSRRAREYTEVGSIIPFNTFSYTSFSPFAFCTGDCPSCSFDVAPSLTSLRYSSDGMRMYPFSIITPTTFIETSNALTSMALSTVPSVKFLPQPRRKNRAKPAVKSGE
mmetsp:Transcript_23666/g.59615  ORF Transcript_23666/g.59615 Transcript_23666/m.59615 type:complete len:225 (+) Transcript_23666:303-977(+)